MENLTDLADEEESGEEGEEEEEEEEGARARALGASALCGQPPTLSSFPQGGLLWGLRLWVSVSPPGTMSRGVQHPTPT